jgi:hypothetical protein
MANGGPRVADHQGAGSSADRGAVRWCKEAARERARAIGELAEVVLRARATARLGHGGAVGGRSVLSARSRPASLSAGCLLALINSSVELY